MSLWTLGGRILIGPDGQPELCDSCPCTGTGTVTPPPTGTGTGTDFGPPFTTGTGTAAAPPCCGYSNPICGFLVTIPDTPPTSTQFIDPEGDRGPCEACHFPPAGTYFLEWKPGLSGGPVCQFAVVAEQDQGGPCGVPPHGVAGDADHYSLGVVDGTCAVATFGTVGLFLYCLFDGSGNPIGWAFSWGAINGLYTATVGSWNYANGASNTLGPYSGCRICDGPMFITVTNVPGPCSYG